MKQAATIEKCSSVYSWLFCLSSTATKRQSARRMTRKHVIRVRVFAVFSFSPNKLPTIQATLQSSVAFYYEDSVLKKKGGKRITYGSNQG